MFLDYIIEKTSIDIRQELDLVTESKMILVQGIGQMFSHQALQRGNEHLEDAIKFGKAGDHENAQRSALKANPYFEAIKKHVVLGESPELWVKVANHAANTLPHETAMAALGSMTHNSAHEGNNVKSSISKAKKLLRAHQMAMSLIAKKLKGNKS